MRSKLNYLIGISLKRKIKTKWFVIANLLIALVIMAAINLDSIITLFGGDFNKKTTIYVIDETNKSYELFKSNIENASILGMDKKDNYKVEKYDKSINEAEKKLKDKKEKGNIVVTFKDDKETTIKSIITTKSFLDKTDYTILNSAIQNTKVALATIESGVPNEVFASINSSAKIERVVLDKDKKSAEENMDMIMSTIFPIFILPFFMLTLFLVQMIGAEVNDEKTTRGMEIIISNVSPKTHFASKVVAANLFVLLQSILLFVYGILGLVIRKLIGGNNIVNGSFDAVLDMAKEVLKSGVGEKLIYIVPLTLLLMILTFIAYSLLAGVLASMTTNIEDFQQLQTPIIIISLIGYYLAMMAGVFEGSIFIKVAAMIPFISAILAPSLLMLGQIGIIEMVIALVLTILVIYLLIKYGLKIYKAGILNYSSTGLWKKMYKALKD